jgi:hypothetical protein
MIVSCVVNAIAGKEIEKAAPVIGEQLYALTALIPDVHLQQVQQSHPLWIYVPAVEIGAVKIGGLTCLTYCARRAISCSNKGFGHEGLV